jgi:microcystin-dependent protein
MAGEESVTLNVNQIPAHSHVPQASTGTGDQQSPANGVWAAQPQLNNYLNTAPSVNMSTAALQSSGGSQPHDNMVPFLAVNFIISMFGTFPSPT